MTVILSEHLPLLASAPNGIQKLRGLILELAVRGKLVPQDPNDEPASELLKQIATERAKLEAEGKIKNSKLIPAVGEDEQPFTLPEGWEWSRLSAISLVNPRNSADDTLIASFVPMAMIGTSFDGRHSQEQRKWAEIKQGFTHFAEGDIGVAKITPCFENSKACVFENLQNRIGAGTTELHIVRPINQTLVPRYVLAYLKAPMFLLVGETRMTGTAGQKRLPKDFLELNPFPLPPLAEQHRIVAKVDELMALCDRLEQEVGAGETAHTKLVETLLGTLTQSTDADDLAANWQRLAEHFNTLFTTETSINALKQTVLQLAVMGKLVPQDPNDEPATELLKRIAKERTRLEAEGAIKKSKALPLVGEDEQPFMIPNAWNWIRLGTLTELITKGSSPKWQGIEYVASDQGVLFITSENVGNYVLRKLDALKYVDPRFNEIEPRSILQYGDILINLVGASIGRTACFNLREVANINQAVALVRLINGENIDSNYLLHFLNSDFAVKHMLTSQVVNAQPNISLTDVRDFPIPFPPLQEQNRIVAKVDELMALCDRLKADLIESRKRQDQLATTLIDTALKAA